MEGRARLRPRFAPAVPCTATTSTTIHPCSLARYKGFFPESGSDTTVRSIEEKKTYRGPAQLRRYLIAKLTTCWTQVSKRKPWHQLGSEQEPGPRRSPQEPQAPEEGDGPPLAGPLALTANTESCGANLAPSTRQDTHRLLVPATPELQIGESHFLRRDRPQKIGIPLTPLPTNLRSQHHLKFPAHLKSWSGACASENACHSFHAPARPLSGGHRGKRWPVSFSPAGWPSSRRSASDQWAWRRNSTFATGKACSARDADGHYSSCLKKVQAIPLTCWE